MASQTRKFRKLCFICHCISGLAQTCGDRIQKQGFRIPSYINPEQGTRLIKKPKLTLRRSKVSLSVKLLLRALLDATYEASRSPGLWKLFIAATARAALLFGDPLPMTFPITNDDGFLCGSRGRIFWTRWDAPITFLRSERLRDVAKFPPGLPSCTKGLRRNLRIGIKNNKIPIKPKSIFVPKLT